MRNGKRMMLAQASVVFKSAWVFLLLALTGWSGAQVSDGSEEDVRRVLDGIRRIQTSRPLSDGEDLREFTVSERELNAFIAHTLQYEKVTRELQLKLFEDNRIEGKIKVDLRGADLPGFLRPEMIFYFSGRLETRPGQGRLDLDRIFLDQQPIPAATLDLVIYVAAKINRTTPTTLKDWYPLPYGVIDIRTRKGRASFYF